MKGRASEFASAARLRTKPARKRGERYWITDVLTPLGSSDGSQARPRKCR